MGSYFEHHICAGLYHLADKFEQVFDPTRFSVSLSNHSEVRKLVSELKKGEQVILDDLQEVAGKLRDYSSQLHSLQMTRKQVLSAVEYHREEVSRYRRSIKNKKRELLNKL